MIQLLLASKSPRRLALIRQMGWDVETVPARFVEAETVDAVKAREAELPEGALAQVPEDAWVPLFNAYGKGAAAAEELYADDPRPIIAADTVVELDGETLGKPVDEVDARRMLALLSGKTHTVITALCLLHFGRVTLHVERTAVHFRPLTKEEISWYVSTGEPMDKAGAYGIQGKGAVLVDRIAGSYDNVVGLPLAALYEMLIEAGVKIY